MYLNTVKKTTIKVTKISKLGFMLQSVGSEKTIKEKKNSLICELTY